jgi:hypothetical protein
MQMKKSEVQEQLSTLYLRLNGFFVSGFIVHAPPGAEQSNKTQLDALAIRFPHNAEPERLVRPSEYLQLSSEKTDIIICEVKGGAEKLQFNQALRTDFSVLQSVLRWVGAFEDHEINEIVGPLQELLMPRERDSSDHFRTLACPRDYQIRCVLFAPDQPAPRRNQMRYIHGQEIISHMWKCLHDKNLRPECAIRYDFGLWGPYESLVRVFKKAIQEPTLPEIYREFEVNDP